MALENMLSTAEARWLAKPFLRAFRSRQLNPMFRYDTGIHVLVFSVAGRDYLVGIENARNFGDMIAESFADRILHDDKEEGMEA